MYDFLKIAVEKIRIEIWVFVLYVLNVYIFYMKDSDVEMIYNYVNQFEFLSKLLNYDFAFFTIEMIFLILRVYTISIVVASLFVVLNFPKTKNRIKKFIRNIIYFRDEKSSDNFKNDPVNFEKYMYDIRNLMQKLYQVQERAENNEFTIDEFKEITTKLNDEINDKLIILEKCNKEDKIQIKERKTQIKQFNTISNRVNKFFSFEKTASDLIILSYIALLLFSIVYRYGIFIQKIEYESILTILAANSAHFGLVQYFSWLVNTLDSKNTPTKNDNK